ncbi:MAG: GNAT family N-acetyltransferase [Candidatus Methanomethyliales bacterium]|nr:GNAT family N-acetyltransferase [Candidatus Methanomethylicales archaeon]
MNEASSEEEESTQSNIEIVPAISKDIEGIATVLRESFPGKAKYYKIRSWEHESKKILRSDKGWITFIAVHQGTIVGVLAARHLKTINPTVRIEWIAVAKSFRQRGIGKALFDHLTTWLTTTFFHQQVRITLRARTDVQNFYRKLGLRCYGRGWMKKRIGGQNGILGQSKSTRNGK